MKLTEEQKKAMTHYKGPALIIAVPGAGKTTVLLERIKYLTKNKKVNPKRILSITFSKQQALDMKERFGQNPTHFSTIHAFCYSLIRYHQKINGRQLRLIEEQGFSKHTVIRRLYMEFYRRHIADDELDKFFRHYG
ncbi:MAG: UvrD-helicase domain-containing protein, partial [Tissierellia bacterium]|nr:UvrD-helicase domain-containing protein [Tissierellia bacterium]